MNHSQRHASKRRLAIERIENRLMLSGDGFSGINTDTFNLDPLSVDYAVISSDPVLPVAPLAITPSPAAPSQIAPSLAADFDGTLTIVDTSAIRGSTLLNHVSLLPTSTAMGATLDRLNQWWNDVGQSPSLGVWPSLADLSLPSGAWNSSGGVTLHFFGNGVGQEIKFVPAGSPASDALDARVHADSIVRSVIDTDSLPANRESSSTPVSRPMIPTLSDRYDVAAPVGHVDVTAAIDRLPVAGSPLSLVIAPAVPANAYLPIGQSDAQVNIGQVIDELLSSSNDFIDQVLPDDASSNASDDIQLTGFGGTPQVDSTLHVPVGTGRNQGQAVNTNKVVDEGGMIPVQGIVDALASETMAAPNIEQVVAAEAPVEINGELARVAVMELIDGEADPAAPQLAAEHTFLVAADDVTMTPEQFVESVGREATATFSAARVIAGQAGLAATLVAPANPIYFAAMLSTAADAFTAAAASVPLSAAAAEQGPAGDARHRAFSEWDDEGAAKARALAAEAPNRWLQAAPFVAVLACERVVAAKRKRQQAAAQEALIIPPATVHRPK